MSPEQTPDAAPVDDEARAAADRLKAAIDAHLVACARRTGEGDPDVQEAYDALRAAAEAYDDALFEAYEEVTPFEFQDAPAEPVDDAEPERLGLLVRRDYLLSDLDDLLAAGARAAAESWPEEAGEPPAEQVATAGRAFYELLSAYGVDGLDEIAEDSGLDPAGGTLWVVAQPEEDETLYSAPFESVDEERLLYRLEEVFEG